jgi:hypothetical protein
VANSYRFAEVISVATRILGRPTIEFFDEGCKGFRRVHGACSIVVLVVRPLIDVMKDRAAEMRVLRSVNGG